jgi:hypothetical protein
MSSRHVDIQNLKRHQEFHALKLELEEFCDQMESIADINLEDAMRTDFTTEVLARIIAAKKVRDLLSTLGLIDKAKPKIVDKTME